MTVGNSLGGTGAKLARAVVIVAGVASLVASLLSFVYAKGPHPSFKIKAELTGFCLCE
jgi:hypothetical protein